MITPRMGCPGQGMTLCLTPAAKQPGESLAAPAAAGQGAGTTRFPFQLNRNRSQWLSIAAFLAPLDGAELSAFAKRVAQASAVAGFSAINFGEGVAPCTTVPDGNHGDNFEKGVL